LKESNRLNQRKLSYHRAKKEIPFSDSNFNGATDDQNNNVNQSTEVKVKKPRLQQMTMLSTDNQVSIFKSIDPADPSISTNMMLDNYQSCDSQQVLSSTQPKINSLSQKIREKNSL